VLSGQHGGVEDVPATAMQQDEQRIAQLQDLGEGRMRFSRIQGGSSDSRNTHQSHYYELGFERMLNGSRDPVVVDPFARNCSWGTLTNDIDPETNASNHMDALCWLESLDRQSADFVLFDPPFSKRQADEKYAGHVNVYTDPGYVKKCFKEIASILKPGGKVLILGYNSSKHSKILELEEGWIVNFGGNRNDVVMTIWRKAQTTLGDWA